MRTWKSVSSTRSATARVATVLVVLAFVFVAVPAWGEGGTAVVQIELSPEGGDTLMVCQDAPFVAEQGARTAKERADEVVSRVVEAVKYPDVKATYDDPSSKCAQAVLPGPLTERYSFRQIVMTIDGNRLASAMHALGYDRFEVHVCGPEDLSFEVPDGDVEESTRCAKKGWVVRDAARFRMFLGATSAPSDVPTGGPPLPDDAPAGSGGAVYVTIDVRATFRDGIYLCTDEPLGDDFELASVVVGSLGAVDPSYRYDDIDDCIGITPGEPLGERWGAHGRLFELDATTLYRQLVNVGYDDVFVDVCVPKLPSSVRVESGEEAEPSCEGKGYSWAAPVVADVVFQATSKTVLRGTLAVVGGLLVALGFAAWLVVVARRSAVSSFASRPLFSWIFTGLAALVAGLAWLFVPYDSGFIHAMQLYNELDVGFEVLFLLLTTVFVAALLALAGVWAILSTRKRFRHVLVDSQMEAPEPYAYDRTAQARVRSVAVAYLVTMLATCVLGIMFAPEGMTTIAVVIVATAAALGLPLLTTLATVAGTSRMQPENEEPVVRALRALGVKVRKVVVSDGVAPLFRTGPYRPASVATPGVIAFRTAVVWRHAAGLPPAQLAAGLATRRAGTEGVWPALAFMFVAFVVRAALLESTWWPFLAPLGVVALSLWLTYFGGARARKRARAPALRGDFLAGQLTFGRMEARIVAPRNLGSRLGPWKRAWVDARINARRFAERLGLDEADVAGLEHEVVRTEYARFAEARSTAT